MFVILGMSFWIGLAGDQLPVEFLGFLGIIPLGIGLVGVWRLMRNTTAGPSGSIDNIDNAKTVFVASFFTQVANGADTVVSKIVARYANKITPLLLIFVGVYVILNTATDLMPDS